MMEDVAGSLSLSISIWISAKVWKHDSQSIDRAHLISIRLYGFLIRSLDNRSPRRLLVLSCSITRKIEEGGADE